MLFALCSLLKSQNLIPNPSFEIYDTCPTDLDQVYLSSPWFDPTNASSDYFNTCSVGTNVSIPKNYYGYQFPYNGNAFMGFAVYEGNLAQNWREYIGVKLIAPLEKDSEYCFSAYISAAGNFKSFINSVGILLLQDTLGISNYYPTNIPYIPDANYDTIMADTLSWKLVNLNFKAKAACNYLIIGNFKIDIQLSLQNNNPNGFDGAYDYIDSVRLYKCNTYSVYNKFIIPNVVTNNNDNINDVFFIKGLQENTEVNIYNRWGTKIYYTGNYKNDWKPNESDGTYYYIIKSANKTYKGFLEIIK